MKVCLLKHVNTTYPQDEIVCLWDYSKDDLLQLATFVQNVAMSEENHILTRLRFIQSSDITLVFKTDKKDFGVIQTDDYYECRLTKKSYLNMVESILKMSDAPQIGYRWLYNLDTPIDLLLSYNCKW